MVVLALALVWCAPGAHVEVRSGSAAADGGTSGQHSPGSADPSSVAPASDGEVCAVRDAIAAALRASSEDWAAGLAEETAAASCSLEPDGTARIGPWSMSACTGDCALQFLYRRAGAQVPAYAARVERTDQGFACTDLGQFLVMP
jgi:hypothetical protein